VPVFDPIIRKEGVNVGQRNGLSIPLLAKLTMEDHNRCIQVGTLDEVINMPSTIVRRSGVIVGNW
jgi:hypothetical protein